MTSFVFGGGRGGGGFTLGPAQNVFTGADRAAAESARQVYESANPAWLAQYNADTSLNIILQYTDNGDGVAVYQVRNSAGTAWLDNSSARGVAGRDGMADIPGVPDGTIPMVQGGALVASSMREVSDLIESAKSLGIPDNSLNFLNLRISASQGRFIAYDMFNQVYALIGSRPLTAAGTGTFSIELATARQGPVVFQGRTDVTHTTTEIAFNFTNITKAIIDNWVTRGTNGKFYIQIHGGTDANARVIYRSHTPAQIADGDVFDLTGDPGTSDFVLDTSLEPAFQDTGQDLYVRLLSPDATPFTILGSVTTQTDVDADPLGFTVVGQNVPYFGTRFWTIVDERILTEADLPNMFNAPAINAFSIPSVTNTSPQAPFSLSGTQTFSYEITNTVNVQSAVIEQNGSVIDTLTESEITAGSADVNITTVNLAAGQSVTFTIKVTDTQSTVITRNFVIRSPQAHEFAYVGDEDLVADFSTVDVSTYQSFDVTDGGAQFQFTEQVPNTEFLGVLVPANRDVVNIVDVLTGQDALSEFTKTTGVRTINSQSYNLYTIQNNSGFSGAFSFNITVGG